MSSRNVFELTLLTVLLIVYLRLSIFGRDFTKTGTTILKSIVSKKQSKIILKPGNSQRKTSYNESESFEENQYKTVKKDESA